MAEESFQEKTEDATPRRREEARKKGQVPKSKELASIAVLFASISIFFWGASFYYYQNAYLIKYYLQIAGTTHLSQGNILEIMKRLLFQVFVILLPIMSATVIVAIFSNVLQFGLLFSFEAIEPKLSKISPLEGIKRLFSMQSLMEFFKSLFKVIIVAAVTYFAIKSEMDNLLPLVSLDPIQIMVYMSKISLSILWKSSIALLILAIIDFIYQRWEFEKNLKMTKEEIKEEYKQSEGDPFVKSRIRQIQREMARKRMMAEVPKADVIITNPIHLAIAIKYERGQMESPQIIAKGADNIAQKIKEVAEENAIPVIENIPLAHSLYKIDIGKFIPTELFGAVAEILAHVYTLKKKKNK
jgi:flagellar biosynthetic protein FlhB